MLAKLLLIVFIFTLAQVNSQATCPDGWTKWKDEKCFLLMQNYSNFHGAKEACQSIKGTLANVREEEQQLFLTHFIFETSQVDIGVWIGGTRVGDSQTEFQWEDGTPFDYANWAVGSPTELDGRNCVAMQSNYTKTVEAQGTWKDTTCNSPWYYVCETKLSWTLEDVIAVLIETRRQLTETRSNPVPVGFIYTQFPEQPIPSTIWPSVTWTEVTSQFAGKFFRAAGGNAAEFGQTQNGDSPRLSQVSSRGLDDDYNFHIAITPGTWSEYLYAGGTTSGIAYAHRFLVTNPEVRPINTSIRIWKRSA